MSYAYRNNQYIGNTSQYKGNISIHKTKLLWCICVWQMHLILNMKCYAFTVYEGGGCVEGNFGDVVVGV